MIEDTLSVSEGSHSKTNSSDTISSSDESDTSTLPSALLSPSEQMPFSLFFPDPYSINPREVVVTTLDQEVSPSGATSEASTFEVSPLPLSTASSRKLGYLMPPLISSPINESRSLSKDDDATLKGYRIFLIERLSEILLEL